MASLMTCRCWIWETACNSTFKVNTILGKGVFNLKYETSEGNLEIEDFFARKKKVTETEVCGYIYMKFTVNFVYIWDDVKLYID